MFAAAFAFATSRIGALLIGTVLAVAVFFGWGEYQYRAGKAAGALSERLVWEEARRKLIAAHEARMAVSEAAIAKAEQQYIAYQAESAIRLNGLETTIAEMEADLANAAPACRAVMPSRLSRELNRIR
jgi:predicted negative regulator of RcsB-dependent stress response